MSRPSNITNRIRTLENENANVPLDLYTINRYLDSLQNQIDGVVASEQLAKNKIRKIGLVLNEQETIREKTERYDSKTGFICKKVIKALKEKKKMNERTLALSRDLIQETNN